MNSGVKGSMAGTSLAQGITRLLAPTDKASALMEEFNIEIARNSDGGLDLENTIKNLQTAFAGMSKETQVANAKVIFGQTALKGWLPLISASADEWDELGSKIKNSSGATAEMMEEIQKSGAFQFKIMTSAISEFLIVVGDALAPAMTKIAETVTEVSNKLSDWVTKMKETNPAMLEFIGTVGMLGIAVPPVIMMLGGFTRGLGSLYSGIGGGLTKMLDFKKHLLEVANGTRTATEGSSLLSKGLGTLVSKFGLASVGAMAGATALLGVASVIGENENALSWLIDKWGVFGTVVAGTCELVSGIVQATLGNIIVALKGVGKSVVALLTGNWRDIDDIWAETWHEMESITARATSNIAMESTKAIKNINKMTKSELNELGGHYENVYEKIKGVNAENYKSIAKNLSRNFEDVNNDMLTTMRGTSDVMAILFEGVYEGMEGSLRTKKLEENLKGLVKTGKYSADEIAKDFEKAGSLISSNFSTGLKQVEEEVATISRHINNLSKDGFNGVAKNLTGTIKSMNEETFNELKTMGGTWEKLFAGIDDKSAVSKETITKNLRALGSDSSAIVEALTKEMKDAYKDATDGIKGLMDETAEAVEGTAGSVSESFVSMLDVIKNGSEQGLDEVAGIFAEGLQSLDVETVKSLMDTSDHWYSILNGIVDENGQLIEGFANQVLWNLGWISEQTPEKMEGFKTGLLQALVDANLITADQFEVMVTNVEQSGLDTAVETVAENVKKGLDITGSDEPFGRTLRNISSTLGEEASAIESNSIMLGESLDKALDVKDKDIELGNTFRNVAGFVATEGLNIVSETEKVGDGIEEGLSLDGTQTKVQEELNNINSTIGESGGTLSETAKKTGEEARNSFLTGLSQPVEGEVGLDSQLINEEHLMEQMGLAGQKAVTRFAEAWVENSTVLSEALELTVSMIGEQMTKSIDAISLAMDGVNMKTALLNDTVGLVKGNFETLNASGLNILKSSVDTTDTSMLKLMDSTMKTRAEVNNLGTKSLGALTTDIKDSDARMLILKSNTTLTATEMQKLADKKLTNLGTNIDNVKAKLDKAKTSLENLLSKFKELKDYSLSAITNRVGTLNDKILQGISNAGTFRSRLQQLNEVTFGNLINGLANVNSWLGTVRSSAYTTSSAVNTVSTAKPRSIEEEKPSPYISLASIGSMIDAQAYTTSASARIDMSKYQTRGSYYTPNSMAGTGSKAREVQHQTQQLSLLEKQNELLMQLLVATSSNSGVNVSLELDGKQIAKASAKYVEKEISTINKRKSRLGGNF